MENPEQPIENTPEAVTKERKKPNITPEDRAQRAERMREMATKRNELLKKQKAERFEHQQPQEAKPKTPRIKKEKIAVEPAKEPPTPEPVVAPAKPVKQEKPKAKPKAKPVKVKTLVIQSSSDSEDYAGDTTGESDSEEEVVYIAKKSKSKPELTKPKAKPLRTTVSAPAVLAPVEPAIRVKFF